VERDSLGQTQPFRCVHTAVGSAVAQPGSPLVRQLHCRTSCYDDLAGRQSFGRDSDTTRTATQEDLILRHSVSLTPYCPLHTPYCSRPTPSYSLYTPYSAPRTPYCSTPSSPLSPLPASLRSRNCDFGKSGIDTRAVMGVPLFAHSKIGQPPLFRHLLSPVQFFNSRRMKGNRRVCTSTRRSRSSIGDEVLPKFINTNSFAYSMPMYDKSVPSCFALL